MKVKGLWSSARIKKKTMMEEHIATTPEQSALLRDSGVKTETADMYRWRGSCNGNTRLAMIEPGSCADFWRIYKDSTAVEPAWSLSTLWIMASCAEARLEFCTGDINPAGMIAILVDSIVKALHAQWER
jgi:hypothetical protein